MHFKPLGFTLLEVIAALAITSITALSVLSVANHATHKAQRFANQQLAYYVLNNQLVRGTIDPQSIKEGTSSVSEQGRNWTVVTEVTTSTTNKAKQVTFNIQAAGSNIIVASSSIWVGM